MPARHRIVKDEAEHDAVSRWRHMYGWGPGGRRYWKNRINRRERRLAKAELRGPAEARG